MGYVVWLLKSWPGQLDKQLCFHTRGPHPLLALLSPGGRDAVEYTPLAALSYGHIQGYLAHSKPHPPRTLQKDYAYGPTVDLEVGHFWYERGTPVIN